MMNNKPETVASTLPKSWYRYCVEIIEVSEGTSESTKIEKVRPLRCLGAQKITSNYWRDYWRLSQSSFVGAGTELGKDAKVQDENYEYLKDEDETKDKKEDLEENYENEERNEKHYEEEENTKNNNMYRTLHVDAKNNAGNLAMRVVQASRAMLLTLFHGPVSCSEEGHRGACLVSVTFPIGCQLVFDPGGDLCEIWTKEFKQRSEHCKKRNREKKIML